MRSQAGGGARRRVALGNGVNVQGLWEADLVVSKGGGDCCRSQEDVTVLSEYSRGLAGGRKPAPLGQAGIVPGLCDMGGCVADLIRGSTVGAGTSL